MPVMLFYQVKHNGSEPATRAGNDRNGQGAFFPAAEITSDSNAWHVRLALPGVDPNDVNIEVTNNVLSISGERRHESEPKTERPTPFTELSYGRFERRFTIPDRVDVDKVEATFRHGMLELTLPLEEAAKPRRITVKGDGFFKKIAS